MLSLIRNARPMLCLLAFTTAPSGCNFFQKPPSTELAVQLLDTTLVNGVLISAVPRPGSKVSGVYQNDLPNGNPAGSVYTFPQTAMDDYAIARIENARIGARWQITFYLNPPCYDNVHYSPGQNVYQFSDYYNALNSGGYSDIDEACFFETETKPAGP